MGFDFFAEVVAKLARDIAGDGLNDLDDLGEFDAGGKGAEAVA